MADVWFRKLGFSRNPFSIKPAAFTYDLFGVNSSGVLSGIEDGKVLFVEAPIGYGKTTLLKSIVHRFGGKRKVIYAHALDSEMIDVKSLLKRASFANFITGSLPEGMILVVDEAQNVMPETSAEIMQFYKSGNIRAVVFFGTKYSSDAFVEELGKMMNGNVIRLSKPTPEQAVSIIRSRIGNLPVLSNNAITWAYKRAQGSPRQLLQICEDICRSSVEKGDLSASDAEFPALSHSESSENVSTATKLVEESEAVSSTPALVVSSEPVSAVISVVSKKHIVRARRKAVVKATPVAKSSIKPAKQATAKPKVHAAKAEKAPKAKASKPASHHRAEAKGRKPANPSSKQPKEAPQDTNPQGSYWGEFMGMQK